MDQWCDQASREKQLAEELQFWVWHGGWVTFESRLERGGARARQMLGVGTAQPMSSLSMARQLERAWPVCRQHCSWSDPAFLSHLQSHYSHITVQAPANRGWSFSPSTFGKCVPLERSCPQNAPYLQSLLPCSQILAWMSLFPEVFPWVTHYPMASPGLS